MGWGIRAVSPYIPPGLVSLGITREHPLQTSLAQWRGLETTVIWRRRSYWVQRHDCHDGRQDGTQGWRSVFDPSPSPRASSPTYLSPPSPHLRVLCCHYPDGDFPNHLVAPLPTGQLGHSLTPLRTHHLGRALLYSASVPLPASLPANPFPLALGKLLCPRSLLWFCVLSLLIDTVSWIKVTPLTPLISGLASAPITNSSQSVVSHNAHGFERITLLLRSRRLRDAGSTTCRSSRIPIL